MKPNDVKYEIWLVPTDAKIRSSKLAGPYWAKSFANWVLHREKINHGGEACEIVMKEMK